MGAAPRFLFWCLKLQKPSLLLLDSWSKCLYRLKMKVEIWCFLVFSVSAVGSWSRILYSWSRHTVFSSRHRFGCFLICCCGFDTTKEGSTTEGLVQSYQLKPLIPLCHQSKKQKRLNWCDEWKKTLLSMKFHKTPFYTGLQPSQLPNPYFVLTTKLIEDYLLIWMIFFKDSTKVRRRTIRIYHPCLLIFLSCIWKRRWWLTLSDWIISMLLQAGNIGRISVCFKHLLAESRFIWLLLLISPFRVSALMVEEME